MSQDIKVKASVTHRTIKSTGKVGFIRSVDESEPYTGSYDVTIVNTQVLPTNNKRMTSDLTVRQGAETYTGATTVNAEFTDVVLNTQNKLVQSNITVKQGIPKYTGPYSMQIDLPGTHNLAVKDKYCDKNIQVVQPYGPYSGPMNFTVRDSTIVQVFANEWINGVMFINQGYERFDGNTELWINTRRSGVHEWFVDGYFYDTQYDPDTDEYIEVESFIADFVLSTQDKYFDRDIHVQFPPYSGSKQFTVTDSPIVIPTENKFVNGNITVNQGIPLYTGATSFTIVDSGLTIATNGKRLNSDITVDISTLEALAEDISEVVG